jgi:polysaccharide biosynthesis/export protein
VPPHILRRSLPALTLTLLFAAAGCADLGKYVWIQNYEEPAESAGGFVLAVGDTVQVRVFNQENLTTRARIRSDGKITLPLLSDVEAAGYTPSRLGQQLETRFKEFIKLPVVSVSVDDVRPLSVPVAGEVGRQGIVNVERGATLLQVIMSAGGPNELAHADRIFVIRQGDPPVRIRFSWPSILRGEPHASRFEIKPGDVIVVE